MPEFLSPLLPYAPLLIFVAAFLDVFCLTGLFLYGGAMLGTIVFLLMTGSITPGVIFWMATAGTLTGSSVNFYIGRYSSDLPFVKKLLQKPAAVKLQSYGIKKHLFIFMVLGRFITIARPLYGLTLGTLKVSPRQFFSYEIPIILFWVGIWLLIVMQGEQFLSGYFLK